jgi:hypothetical protein
MILSLLALMALQSTAQAKTAWDLPDFKITVAKTSASRTDRTYTPPAEQDCRERIKYIICLVDPPSTPNDDSPRLCLPNSGAYAKPLEEVYYLLPPHLQKMFCHLSTINVEKDFIGSAYGGVLFEADKKTLRGGIIGIRESLLKGDVSLNRWASWKEQLHFGADPVKIEPMAHLPQVKATNGDDPRFMLYFLIAHEFGHIFDFTNLVNETLNCSEENCPIKPGTFGAISFEKNQIPLPQFEFPLRKALCFYFCEGKFIDVNLQDELYAQLGRTNFATAYTTRYEQEDFADTFALHSMRKDWKMNYVIRTVSGAIFDPMARLESEDLRAKREYIERFLASNYRYPEAGSQIKKANP